MNSAGRHETDICIGGGQGFDHRYTASGFSGKELELRQSVGQRMLHLGGRAYPRKNRVAFLQTVLHYLWIEAGTYQKAGACLYGSISRCI